MRKLAANSDHGAPALRKFSVTYIFGLEERQDDQHEDSNLIPESER